MTGKTQGWFDVDRDGLGSLLERKGREFVLYELYQNVVDQAITTADIVVEQIDAEWARITVTDDDPNGFAKLSDAYTVFARSSKRDNPEKRGRFNLGEKLVLSLCRTATVVTTSGTIKFNLDGTRTRSDTATRPVGSEFSAEIRMTDEQRTEALAKMLLVLPPKDVSITVNGRRLIYREPLIVEKHRLMTEIDDKETGFLSRHKRVCEVAIHEPYEGERGTLYELGIPVCDSGHRWHIDVGQKVPLALDREHVTQAFLNETHTITLNAVHSLLTADDVSQAWAQTALSDKDASPAAVKAVITARFGENAVVYDPSDRDANARALETGCTIITGSQLSKAQWQNVRAAEAALPAGRIFASPRPFTLDGAVPKHVENPTDAQRRFVAYAVWMHDQLGLGPLLVSLLDDRDWNFLAAYGDGHLYANARRVRLDADTVEVDRVLIHEFAHARVSDHMGERFHDECCSIGARLHRMTYTFGGYGEPPVIATRVPEEACPA